MQIAPPASKFWNVQKDRHLRYWYGQVHVDPKILAMELHTCEAKVKARLRELNILRRRPAL